MSNNEKAKNKLMETMRMTKSDPGKKADPVTSEQTKPAQVNKPVTPKKTDSAKQKAVKVTKNLSADPYQTARRVWPD